MRRTVVALPTGIFAKKILIFFIIILYIKKIYVNLSRKRNITNRQNDEIRPPVKGLPLIQTLLPLCFIYGSDRFVIRFYPPHISTYKLLPNKELSSGQQYLHNPCGICRHHNVGSDMSYARIIPKLASASAIETHRHPQ